MKRETEVGRERERERNVKGCKEVHLVWYKINSNNISFLLQKFSIREITSFLSIYCTILR